MTISSKPTGRLGERITSTVFKEFLQWCQRNHRGPTPPATEEIAAPADFKELAAFAEQRPNELIRLLER